MNALGQPGIAWLASALLASGLCGVLVTLLNAPTSVPALSRYRDWFDAGLARMLLPPTGTRLARVQITLVATVLLVAWIGSQPLALCLCALPFVLPRVLLQRALLRRREAIEQQLDGWLMGLSSALRAAPALGDAIESTLPLVQGALRGELQVVMRAFRLGTPLDEGLIAMAKRVGSPALAAALTTLRVARRTGGELGATLERTADALREMARLEGVVRSETASGRAQAVTISLVPVPLVGVLHWLNPDYLKPLFSTALGNALLAIAIMLWLVAFLWARKIVEVDL